MITKNDTFGVGKQPFAYILDLGAQSSPKGVHKAAQGSPCYSKWSPKGAKSVQNGTPRENQSSNIASKTT